MKFPEIILKFGRPSHQGDIITEYSVPIYHQLLNDNNVYVGFSPGIKEMLTENKKFSLAMLTFHGMGVLFFRQENGEWIVD